MTTTFPTLFLNRKSRSKSREGHRHDELSFTCILLHGVLSLFALVAMDETRESAAQGVPGTPGIREVRSEPRSENLEPGARTGENPSLGIRMVNCRAEIDTSPPFGSVKEAVTRFGGSGPWLPLYKLGEAFNNIEDFDIKKVEEQAAELEKDLIVKELETLDVLEELGATKRIVEDLKQQLQKEALKCFVAPYVHSHEHVGTPIIKEMNKENCGKNPGHILQSSSPCPMSTPDLLLMDIKQAKLNLAVSAQERAQELSRLNSSAAPVEATSTFNNPLNIMRSFNPEAGQHNRMVDTKIYDASKPFPPKEENGLSIKTAEMRLFAAHKMEEAARAAEAIALAEIKALSSNERPSGLAQPEIQKVTFALREHSPLNPKAQIPEESTLKKVIDSKYQTDETNISKLTILRWLEEASADVLHSKKVLTEALNRVESANSKQHAAEEALRRWLPDGELKGQVLYNSIKSNKFNQAGNYHNSPLPDVMRSTTTNNDPKPVLRSTVSLRDVLSRKQVPEEYGTRKEMDDHAARQKVALSQMLRALREDLTIPTEAEKDRSHQKQYMGQRKKFGFIQISLPLTKQNKKRA
ncbi:WEB family protein [Senna tora]|uniref:WEB family protein n=1 Tax=Senna tora TaxID=362788 RepID=A0A834WEN3_9FABA|nr:WEB family protein [Senna tora]